jgi:benzodiazapine receptor
MATLMNDDAGMRPTGPGRFSRGSAVLAGLVLVPGLLVLGGLSARISGSTTENAWFQTLALPALQPPGPVFGIAWSILYTLIAIAAAVVWGHGRVPGRRLALGLFAAQLAINLSWSPIFFKLHLILPALGVIGLMFVVAVATVFAFARVSRLAAWLMTPYLVWLVFAGALNARIWLLNPAADAFQLGI